MKKLPENLQKILILFIWILFFYFQFQRPFIAKILQNITPTRILTSLLYRLFSLSWIAIPIIIISITKGNFFCWRLCPVGLLCDLIPSFGRTNKTKLNLYIFLILLLSSFFGFNLLALFDPIITFNRAIISFKVSLIEFFIFFSPIILLLLLNIYKKRFWCLKLCPLGAFIDWIVIIKNKKNNTDLERRKFLISIGTGIILGGLLKWKNLKLDPTNRRLIRPPGALPEDQFTDLCIRCGSCVSICLTRTLTPTFLESGLEGVLTPKLTPHIAECDEYCNKCGISCPTQAIKNLPLEIKRNFKIGTAEIDKEKCISWKENKLCLICKEVCSYLAIEIEKNKDNTPCPKIIPRKCRGCGLCEKHCPATPTKAVLVYNTGVGTIIDPNQN